MNFEKSFMVIKPECKHLQPVVVSNILSVEVRINGIYEILITPNELKSIYPDLTGLLWLETIKQFSMSCVVIFVEGYNVIEKIYNLVGTKTNPAECDENSLRYLYGTHEPIILNHNKKFWYNGFHRPINADEAKCEMKILKQLIPDQHH